MAKRHGMDGQARAPILDEGEIFSFLHTRLDGPWGPPILLYNE